MRAIQGERSFTELVTIPFVLSSAVFARMLTLKLSTLFKENVMNRRELLLGSLAMASAAVVSNAQAVEHKHDMHEHHHDASAANAAVATTAADCLQTGEVCLNHCLDLWAKGEKDMASCAKSVNQLLAMCSALQQLANQNSKHLAKLAAVAMAVCKECEEECKKFDKHEACKACGESCAACYKECGKITA